MLPSSKGSNAFRKDKNMKRMISPEELEKMTPDFTKGITTESLNLGNVKLVGEDKGYIGLVITTPQQEVKLARFEGEIDFKSGSPHMSSWPNIKLTHKTTYATQEIAFNAYSTDGDTKVKIDANRAGRIAEIPLAEDPTENGTYTLKLVKNGSSYTYSWVKDGV